MFVRVLERVAPAQLTLCLAMLVLPALLQLRRRHLTHPLRIAMVIKLGGSALTKKASFETLDETRLAETARQLSGAGLAGRAVLIHGAGSFGHFQVSVSFVPLIVSRTVHLSSAAAPLVHRRTSMASQRERATRASPGVASPSHAGTQQPQQPSSATGSKQQQAVAVGKQRPSSSHQCNLSLAAR